MSSENFFKENELLWFDAFAKEDNTIWFFANGFNGLFEADLLTDEVRFLGSVPGEKWRAQALYYNILKYENKLYLIPAYAENLAVYDIVKKEFKLIKIMGEGSKCFGAIIDKCNLYMCGEHSSKIVIVSLDTYNVEYYDVKEYFNNESIKENAIYFRRSVFLFENKLYFPSCSANIVFSMDINDKSFEAHFVGNSEDRFICGTYDGENIWLALLGERGVVKWNPLTKFSNRYFMNDSNAFNAGDILDYSNTLWMFPISDSQILCFDKKTFKWFYQDKFTKYNSDEMTKQNPWGKQAFPFAYLDSNHLLVFASNCRKLIDFDGEQVCEHSFYLSDVIKRNIIVSSNEKYWNEGIIGLNEYIDMVDELY